MRSLVVDTGWCIDTDAHRAVPHLEPRVRRAEPAIETDDIGEGMADVERDAAGEAEEIVDALNAHAREKALEEILGHAFLPSHDWAPIPLDPLPGIKSQSETVG